MFERCEFRWSVLCVVACSAAMAMACGGQSAEAPATSSTSGDEAASSEAEGDGAAMVDLPVAGFRIQPPAGWTQAPGEWARAASQRVDYGSEDFNALVQQHASEPLLVLVKDPTAISATIKVTMRPLGELAGLELMPLAQEITSQLEKALDWFELDGEIERTSLGGLPAASFNTQMVMELDDGTQTEITSRNWLVPRAGAVFIIGASRPSADSEAAGELDRALESIVIEP